MIIMDRGPSLYLKLQIIGLFSIIVSAGSSTHLHGSPSGLQKRSINNNECIALEVPTNQELNEFGKAFTELSLGLNNIPDNFTGDVILFVGNTGVGKSSLVHLLAGEGANFEAQEDGVDSGNYYIVDVSGKFVSNTTIDSTTMYPEAVVDTESGAVLFDTPGFRDTRSAIHEIVATYGLHKVARMSQRVKIALLVNYNSLTPLGTRDDFTNTLESFFNMFNNTEKFQDSTYLIATKTENRFIVRKGQIIPVSPETHIKGVVQFMNGVSQTLENRKGKYGDEKFIKNAQMLIDSLKEKVALFMKPDQSGPITESIPLQQSLKNIRDMLFNDDGYIAVEEDDIGFAVSDKARIYMRNLYDLMNSHVEEVGESFVKPFEKFLTDQAKGVDNIEEIQSSLKHIEQQVEILLKKSNISSNPSEYIDSVTNFVKSVKSMEFCSNIVVDDIKKLDGYLGALEKLTNHHHYTPREWSESFHPLKELVQHEIAYYNFLENLYKTITSHPVMFTDPTIHAIKTRNGPFRWNNVEELKDFTNHLGLTSVGNLQITAERLAELGGFVKNVVGKQSVFCYKSHTLMIVDNVLRTSDLLDQKTMSTCHPSITTVVLVATRKLYIDANLVVQGKNLVVIAPEWHTLGHFSLSVDGESGTNQNLGKAALGREGMVGKHGKPAGRFLGVGLKFFNSHWLTISAMGGNGGRGQDGGDGADGRDGRDGTHRSRIDDSSSIYVFYNTWKRLYLIKADYGTDGGDAGPGGYGGSPGSPGKVEMFSLSKNSPDRSTHRAHYGARGEDGANGRPGKGGLRGCDIIEEEYERRILFFPAGTKRESSFQNCRRRNFDGRLKPRVLSSRPDLVPSPPKPPHLQEVFGAVKQHFEAYDDIVSHAGNVEFHEAFCMQFVC